MDRFIQILFGIALIILGVQCWARYTDVPHRLICGLILHVYGIVVIGAGANVLTRIGRMDYSKPVGQVREMLDRVRKAKPLAAPLVWFPWWLMWVPVAVTLGLDVVLYHCLWPALAIGIPGIVISMWIHKRVLESSERSDNKWKKDVVGKSLAKASMALEEMERARID